jgi:hypothetical protein
VYPIVIRLVAMPDRLAFVALHLEMKPRLAWVVLVSKSALA